MLYIHNDYGYARMPQHISITRPQWELFISDSISEILIRNSKYDARHTHQATYCIEEHVSMFYLSMEDAQYLDLVIDELEESIKECIKKYDGYTELNLIKVNGGYTISAIGDHRILEWHRGRGKADPTPYLNEERAQAEFNKAMAYPLTRHVTDMRLDAEVTRMKPRRKATMESTPATVVYITNPTAFVDAYNLDSIGRGTCEIREAATGDVVYEIIEGTNGFGTSVFGNWDGAGDVYNPMEVGDQFIIYLSKATDETPARATLRMQ